MKQIFNIVIALIFVMNTGCTSLSLHDDYSNPKNIQNTKNIPGSKRFCEAAHKDHKLDSSKTAIENCIVTTGLTANFVEQNNKYKPLWWSLGTSLTVITLTVAGVYIIAIAIGLSNP